MEKIIPKIVPPIKKAGEVLNFLSKKNPSNKKETKGREIKKPSSVPSKIA